MDAQIPLRESQPKKRKAFFGLGSLLLTLLIPATVLTAMLLLQPRNALFDHETGDHRWGWNERGFGMDLDSIYKWLNDYEFKKSEVNFVNILDLMNDDAPVEAPVNLAPIRIVDSRVKKAQAAPLRKKRPPKKPIRVRVSYEAPPILTLDEDHSFQGLSCKKAKDKALKLTDRALKESFDGEVFALETYLREAADALDQSGSELATPRTSCENCTDEQLVNTHPNMIRLRRGWMICPDGTTARPQEEALALFEKTYGKTHLQKYRDDAETFFFACKASETQSVNPEFQIGPAFQIKTGVFEAQARLDFPHPRVREVKFNRKSYFLIAKSVKARVNFNQYTAESWIEGYVSTSGSDSASDNRREFVANSGKLPELVLKEERPDCVRSPRVRLAKRTRSAPQRKIKRRRKAKKRYARKQKGVRRSRVATAPLRARARRRIVRKTKRPNRVARRRPVRRPVKRDESKSLVEAWFVRGVAAKSMSHATVDDVPPQKRKQIKRKSKQPSSLFDALFGGSKKVEEPVS